MTDELTYEGEFKVGDRVVIIDDREDGSWMDEEGTVIKVYRQKGGVFGPTRDVEVVKPDVEDPDDLASTEEGRAKLLAEYDEGDGYFLDSDTYTFEAID